MRSRLGKIVDGKYVFNGSLDLPPYWTEKKVALYPNRTTPPTMHAHFYSSDSEEMFNKNLEIMPEDWEYRHKVINYTFNSENFRCPEFDDIDWENSTLYFGCSTAFGIGVDDTGTLPYHLGKVLNEPVINLGIPGASNQEIFNLSLDILDRFSTPKRVIYSWTGTDRYIIYSDEKTHSQIGPWDLNEEFNVEFDIGYNPHAQFANALVPNITHGLISGMYIAKAAKHLWTGRAELITVSYFDHVAHHFEADMCFEMNNGARDRLHSSSEDNLHNAVVISNIIKQKQNKHLP